MTSRVTTEFCRLVRSRSKEHERVVEAFAFDREMAGTLVGKLREELDSMVRVIYLLQLSDFAERERLMQATLDVQKWTKPTKGGKFVPITDRDMVDVADNLDGWSRSVYRFGCAFIHLSSFHDHETTDPLSRLESVERADVLTHIRRYHGGPSCTDPTFDDLVPYLPMIYLKIRDNLECYVRYLEAGKKP